MKLLSIGTYGLHTIKCPNGKFSYVGTVPAILTKEVKKPGRIPYNQCLVFDTEIEAINYFNSIKHLI